MRPFRHEPEREAKRSAQLVTRPGWRRASISSLLVFGMTYFLPSLTYSSATKFGEPVEKDKGGLSVGETPGAIELLFKGTGNAPVELGFGQLGMY